MKYAFIREHAREFRVVMTCRVLGVSTKALPYIRIHRRISKGFDLCQIPQALRCRVGHGAVPPVQNPLIPPIKQTRRRTQRISSETPVIASLVVVKFLQAAPILNDAFRL